MCIANYSEMIAANMELREICGNGTRQFFIIPSTMWTIVTWESMLAYVRPCKYCFAIDRRRKNGIKVKRSTKEELIKDVRFLIHLPFQDPRLLCVEPLRSTRVNSIFLV